MITRRNFFTKAAAAAAAATGTAAVSSLVHSARADEPVNSRRQDPARSTGYDQGDAPKEFPPGEPGKDYTPVITPNGSALPYKVVGGVKVFHLIAEEVDHEFAPGLRAYCWGFQWPGPWPNDRGCGGGSSAHLRNEQASGKHQHSLARCACTIGYGWSGGA